MIEGKMIRLRALEPLDVDRVHAWINDREVTQYLVARYPLSLAFEEEWLKKATHASEYGDARFAIETLDDVHIGICGLHNGRPEDRHADLGIMIGEKEYWNRGYGTDAMMTVLRFAFYQMNLNKVSLGVFEFNDRAHAMYQKLGFVEEGRAREDYFQDGRYWDIIRMSVLRREFDALHSEQTIGREAAARA
jgi:RimJ/RimL family protein N-acetyltransferase